MSISSRHIRHDWKTWVNWEQKSVRTMCGTTTRWGLAGIPGITPQPEIVVVKDKKLWGWCMGCVRATVYELKQVEKEDVGEYVAVLYSQASDAIYGQYNWSVEKEKLRRLAREASK